MTKTELLKKIAALGKISDAQKRSVTCSLIGHSRVISMCFGYVSCARCEDQIGDTLGGSFDTANRVVVGHRAKNNRPCPTCKKAYKKLDWRDKLFLPEKTLEELLTGLGLNPAAKKTANRRKR